MKRNWDVIRNLLIDIESITYSDSYNLDSSELNDQNGIRSIKAEINMIMKLYFLLEKNGFRK